MEKKLYNNQKQYILKKSKAMLSHEKTIHSFFGVYKNAYSYITHNESSDYVHKKSYVKSISQECRMGLKDAGRILKSMD